MEREGRSGNLLYLFMSRIKNIIILPAYLIVLVDDLLAVAQPTSLPKMYTENIGENSWWICYRYLMRMV